MPLNNQLIKVELKQYLVINLNGNTTTKTWHAAKAVLMLKFITIVPTLKKRNISNY